MVGSWKKVGKPLPDSKQLLNMIEYKVLVGKRQFEIDIRVAIDHSPLSECQSMLARQHY